VGLDLTQYMGLVRKIAQDVHNFQNSVIDYDDLVSAGYLGLEDAAKRYNPEKAKFTTFASRRVRGAMLDEIRRVNHTERVGPPPKIYSLELFRDEDGCLAFEPEDKSVDLIKSAFNSELRVKLAQVIDRLTDIQRQVIIKYYFKQMQLKEIGKELGLSESRIGQIRGEAVLRLRGMLNRRKREFIEG
jgi:RNA polymerase sigma factor for flagellar operon FliA